MKKLNKFLLSPLFPVPTLNIPELCAMKNFVNIFLIVFLAQGCAINYENLDHLSSFDEKGAVVEQFSYRIKRLPVFASDDGMNGIRDSFSERQGFSGSKEYYGEDIPKSGKFIAIDPFYKTPTFPAIAFGYLSAITFTLLPAWSSHDGYFIRYSIYDNGELVNTYQYDRERFFALWIVILPFSWLNLMTPGEYEVFKDINNEFIEQYVADSER